MWDGCGARALSFYAPSPSRTRCCSRPANTTWCCAAPRRPGRSAISPPYYASAPNSVLTFPSTKWRTWLRRNADRVTSTREKFNWARFSNLAAAEAKGDYLLFLNDDIEVIDPEWLDALVEHAQRSEVGVVGPRLLYPDRRVQHAG